MIFLAKGSLIFRSSSNRFKKLPKDEFERERERERVPDDVNKVSVGRTTMRYLI